MFNIKNIKNKFFKNFELNWLNFIKIKIKNLKNIILIEIRSIL